MFGGGERYIVLLNRKPIGRTELAKLEGSEIKMPVHMDALVGKLRKGFLGSL
jgi:hypothetical protein